MPLKVTVVPAFTVSVDGENEKFETLTTLSDDPVAAVSVGAAVAVAPLDADVAVGAPVSPLPVAVEPQPARTARVTMMSSGRARVKYRPLNENDMHASCTRD
jgi:hypothetical protein